MIDEENWFCRQGSAVYRLLKNLKWCPLPMAVALAVCTFGTCEAQAPDTAASSKVIATKLSGFGVPFKINSEDSTYIEVQLYLSEDLGKTWTFYGRKNTDEQEFRFEAEADGEYWFSLKTLSRDRRLLPEGDPQPELKILVDTVKPKLNVHIEADPAGRVICRWQATDKNLAPASVKLLYQPVLSSGTVEPWQAVPVNLGGVARNGVYSDQVGWWPETTEATVNIAIEIADSAGNSVRQTRKVNLPATAWRTRKSATALPNLAATNKQTALKPTAAAANGLPNQPDWAYPGWKSPKELRESSGKSNLPIGPKPPANPVGLNKTADHDSGKPNGVICENGYCRLATKDDMPSRVKEPRLPLTPPATPKTPPRQKLAKQSSRPAAQNNRVANNNRVASTDASMVPLIGSPEEFVAPPTPAGYVALVADNRQSPISQRHELPVLAVSNRPRRLIGRARKRIGNQKVGCKTPPHHHLANLTQRSLRCQFGKHPCPDRQLMYRPIRARCFLKATK